MDLYLLRHAIAEPRSDEKPDADRPLTEAGIERMKQIACGIVKLDIKFDALISSPHLRARETAEILAKAFGAKDKLSINEALAAGAEPGDLLDLLSELPDETAGAVLVGHEPDLSRLVALLVTGHTWAEMVNFKKGGLCKLRLDRLRLGPCATIDWLMWPKQLVEFA